MRPFILLTLILASCAEAPASTPTSTPLPVIVDVVSQQTLSAARTLHGVTSARQEAQLSFSVSGPIDTTLVDVGDTVEAGQPLARLDGAPFRHRVQALSASRAQAKAALDQAQRDLLRLSALEDTQVVSTQQLEQLRTQVEALTASLSALDAQLQEARWAAQQATLRSPIDGVITARFADPGELAGPAAPAFAVRAQSGIEIEVSAPERLIGEVSVGDMVAVSFPLAGIPDREGTVEAVAQAASPGVGLFPVRIALPDAPDLRPGLTAAVALRSGGEPALTVPLVAVVSPSGEAAVVNRIREARVEPVPVELGAVEGERVAVQGALAAGDEIVVRGHLGLTAGAVVEVRR